MLAGLLVSFLQAREARPTQPNTPFRTPQGQSINHIHSFRARPRPPHPTSENPYLSTYLPIYAHPIPSHRPCLLACLPAYLRHSFIHFIDFTPLSPFPFPLSLSYALDSQHLAYRIASHRIVAFSPNPGTPEPPTRLCFASLRFKSHGLLWCGIHWNSVSLRFVSFRCVAFHFVSSHLIPLREIHIYISDEEKFQMKKKTHPNETQPNPIQSKPTQSKPIQTYEKRNCVTDKDEMN